MREPDLVFLRPDRVKRLAAAANRAQPDGADLVMEVVSPGTQNRDRDLNVKRLEYARAGISEYWIIDPETSTVTVLELIAEAYQIASEFTVNQSARSLLLPGFSVSVQAIFEAGEAQVS